MFRHDKYGIWQPAISGENKRVRIAAAEHSEKAAWAEAGELRKHNIQLARAAGGANGKAVMQAQVAED
eukprot:2721820-Prymnesium_polylepis.1